MSLYDLGHQDESFDYNEGFGEDGTGDNYLIDMGDYLVPRVQTVTVPNSRAPVVSCNIDLMYTAPIFGLSQSSTALVPAASGKKGSFTIVIPDAFYFRTSLEAVSFLSTKGLIHITNKGLIISHRNQQQNVQISIHLEERQLLQYIVKPCSSSTKELYGVASVTFSSIAQICKYLGKMDSFILHGTIGANGVVENMHNLKSDTANTIECHPLNHGDYEANIDLLKKFYPEMIPTTKVLNVWLSKVFNNYKTRKFTTVKFTLKDGLVLIGGYKDDHSSVSKCPTNDTYVDSEEVEEENSSTASGTTIIGNGAHGQCLILQHYYVGIDFISERDLLTTITKLSYARSVTHIYLEEYKPLVLVINSGNMGSTVLVFINK